MHEIEEREEIVRGFEGDSYRKGGSFLSEKAVKARQNCPTGSLRSSAAGRKRRQETYTAAQEIHGGTEGADIGLKL